MRRISMFTITMIFLYGLSFNAYSEQVRVNVNGTITNIYDPSGVISDLHIGEAISGNYVYDTNTVDQEPSPEYGFYLHETGTGSIAFDFGNYSVSSQTSATSPLEMFLHNSNTSYTGDEYFVRIGDVEGTGDLLINDVALFMHSTPSSSPLSSDDLTTEIPNPSLFDAGREIHINGSKNGSYFTVQGTIDTLTSDNAFINTKYRYRVTARVNHVNDQGGIMQTNVGDTITATYSIDTTTPGVPSHYDTRYIHTPGSGNIEIEVGAVSFYTEQYANTPEVIVHNDTDYGFDLVVILSDAWSSSDPNINLMHADVAFHGDPNTISSNDIPTEFNLENWENKHLSLSGNGYSPWTIYADIIDIELLEPEEPLSIVPGDTKIHQTQQFDAAFWLKSMMPITSITGTLNGTSITSYLYTMCDIHFTPSQEQVLVCRDTNNILIPGINTLIINITLEDSSIVTKKVVWSML